MKQIRVLLLFATSPDNSTFSYHRAWPRHFQSHPAFACTPVNLAEPGLLSRAATLWQSGTFRGDAVILLHSVFSNACLAPDWLIDRLARLRQPKVYFLGNEYKLMPEKMQFCQRLDVKLLVSQSLSPRVHALYRARLGCEVTGISNTGLDDTLFRPTQAIEDRPIDLGYRAEPAPEYLGHQERQDLARYFTVNAARLGLNVDISLKREDRLAEPQWAAFLNRCKGQLGSEAGGDYFDIDDTTRTATFAYREAHPDGTFADLEQHVFSNVAARVPLRIISGRNVEAAATKTVQVLFEGDYDGYFRPDEHYIPLKKDFSNAEEAVTKFKDPAFRARIAQNAYALVRQELTYDTLLKRFHAALSPLV
jgi:glycosyl transferase family 1